MALPGRNLLDLLAQVARDPIAAGRTNATIQRFDNSALGQRFGRNADYLFGGPDGMSALDALLLAPKVAASTAGMTLEGSNALRNAGEGAGLALTDAIVRATPWEERDPFGVGRQARQARESFDANADANLFERGRAAREGAGESKFLGAMDMLYDPTNLLPGPETLIFDGIKAARGAKIAEQLLHGVPEAGARGAAEEAARIAANPPPLGIPAPPGRGSIDDLRNALWDAVDEAANPRDAQLQAGLRRAVDEAAQTPGAVPLRSWEDPGLKGNVPFADLVSGVGTKRHGRGLGPQVPQAAEEVAQAIDNAAPATPFAGEYGDFLDLARTVPGELPSPSSKFWDRLGAEPEAVRGFFDQAHREGVLGTTDAGLSALRPVEEFPQAASRAEGLASLTPDEVRQLAHIAYPNDNAIANAARKYPTTAELADAALARIGGSRDALEYIASSNPPLAKKLAYMPDGGGVGGAMFVFPGGHLAAQGARTFGRAVAAGTPLATTAAGGIVGGAAGALGGAGLGFLQADGDLGDRLHAAKEGATTGALAGAFIGGLGGATIGKNTTPEAARLLIQKANAAGVEGTKAALTGAKTRRLGPKAIASYWAGQVVRHPKNIFNDELWNDLLTGALSPQSRQYIKDVRDSIVQRMNLTDPYARLSSPVRSLLDTFGMTGYLPELGLPMAKAVEDKGLTIGQEIALSTGLSAANPQGFAQSALGLLAGGPVKGAANTWWRPFFNAVNGSMNQTFREAALVGEAGKFAAKGRQALIDAGYTAFKALPEDGLIHARDVEKMLGTREAKVWQAVQKNAMGLGEGRVRFLYGDYSDASKTGLKGFVERKLGTVVPFASWAIRAYPVALEMAAEHPLIALGLVRASQELAHGAGEDDRPGYTAGMIPIPDKAGLLTGGQGSTTYLDLIGGISPVGGDMFAPADKNQQPQNPYQEVSQGLQKLGLPGPNPLVQSLAYIMGFDYKSPGALSRTQGMENALALIPGNPDLPDIGGGALRLARSKVSPLVAGTDIGALLGAEADTSPSQYDPIGRRFDELVAARTGKRLDDPANKAYLLDLAFGRGDLYEQAERETLLGGAARNIASMSSPVGVATQTEDNRRARAATGKVPFDYGDIAALPQGTAARRQAEQARKAALAADPWAEPYGIGGRQEAQDELMRIIMDRYRKAGIRPTQAGIQEQIRLMEAAAERQRITHP
jgi:hypothetical protein